MTENAQEIRYNEECPEHSTEAKKEYDFGMHDATVAVFSGCKCAVTLNHDGILSSQEYYTSYAQAEGRARMIVMQRGRGR